MKAVLIVVMFFAFGLTTNVKTQSITDEDFCASNKKLDAQLNKLYQQVLVDYRKDKLFILKLREAQRAWIEFSNKHLDSLYPRPGTYGSVNRTCQCQVMNGLIESRIQQLKQWVDGFEEGEVCAGSVKIKESK
jgi:uncharacterized protein YecT (DUF1311 family)